MNNQHALTGSADAQQHFLDAKVDLFLFDLKNEASEHGFKAGESWTLELATEGEMAALKKIHYPLVSVRLQGSALLGAYQQVKDKLQQPLSKTDLTLTSGELERDDKNHLAAYPARIVRK